MSVTCPLCSENIITHMSRADEEHWDHSLCIQQWKFGQEQANGCPGFLCPACFNPTKLMYDFLDLGGGGESFPFNTEKIPNNQQEQEQHTENGNEFLAPSTFTTPAEHNPWVESQSDGRNELEEPSLDNLPAPGEEKFSGPILSIMRETDSLSLGDVENEMEESSSVQKRKGTKKSASSSQMPMMNRKCATLSVKRYPCHIKDCEKIYAHRSSRSKHLNGFHGTKWECFICHEKMNKGSAKRHLLTRHN